VARGIVIQSKVHRGSKVDNRCYGSMPSGYEGRPGTQAKQSFLPSFRNSGSLIHF